MCRSMDCGVATAAATLLVDRKFESKSQPHASSFHGPFVFRLIWASTTRNSLNVSVLPDHVFRVSMGSVQ